jgi:hypothetical protein
MSTHQPPPPTFAQAELVIDQIRKQIQTLARCEDLDLRQLFATDIMDSLCEVEHLLEIHRSHLAG